MRNFAGSRQSESDMENTAGIGIGRKTGQRANAKCRSLLGGFRRIGLASASIVVLALAAPLAVIPTASAQVLEEVVVTAQKREQSLQEVGISVTTFSGDQIRELGLNTTADIVSQTPGLNVVTPFGGGNNVAFTLRGVGLNDFSEANEAPVAVYVDGVYNATLAGLGFQLFDIERAEVLRGPQGTLYGRNTTGGLVGFVTRKPSQETTGYVDLSFGENSQVRLEGAGGGALSDTLSARLSVLYHAHDGYIENVNPGVKAAGETDDIGARLQFLYEADDNTSALLNLHMGKADHVASAYKHSTAIETPDGDVVELDPSVNFYDTCAGCDLTGYVDTTGDFYTTANDREPFIDLDTFGASLTIDRGWGEYDFRSISAYESVEKFFGEDTDVTPSPFIEVTNPVDSTQFTQELQLSGTTGGNTWLVGLYYYTRDIDSGTRTDLSRETFIRFPINTNTTYNDDTSSISVFGQYEWALSDQWTLISGLRFTSEERDFNMQVNDDSGVLPNPVFDFTESAVGDLTNHDTDNVSFRVELDYHASENWLWHGSIARGIKGAGFNIDIGIDPRTPDEIPFDEEKLLAYELGFKSTLGEGRVRWNTAAFFYDYDDFQAFSFEGLSNVVSNKQANVYGIDSELVASPAEGWEFSLGVSLLDTEVEDIKTRVSTIIDREIPLSPKVTINALARYEWPAFAGLLAVQADMQHVGKQHFDILNTTIATEDAYTIGNLRVSFTNGSRNTSIAIWVKNVGDEEYRTYAIPVPFLGFNQNMVGMPRWFGVSLQRHW